MRILIVVLLVLLVWALVQGQAKYRRYRRHRKQAVALRVRFHPFHNMRRLCLEGAIYMAQTFKDNDPNGTVTIQPVSIKGNPAPVDGPAVFETVTPEGQEPVIVIESRGASNVADYVLTGKTGQATLTVTADADLGEGVKTISETVLIDVVSSEATGLGITFTPVAVEPEPEPETTPEE